ncbi:ribonuclease H-like domain-containing protein, partial [Tanacetum coccineum]
MSQRIESFEDQESLGVPEDASKQGRSIKDIDVDVDVSLVDETQRETGWIDLMLILEKEDACKERVGKEQQKESSKKQKLEEEKELEEVDEIDEAELKKLLVIKKDEDIAIDAIPLATKLQVIIDYKHHKEVTGSTDEIPPPPPPPPSSSQTHNPTNSHTQGQIKVIASQNCRRDCSQKKEREKQEHLLMALPEDHLAKFHKMTDAKEMWDAIKSRFGGNDESKKMQKYILKQQFEGFSHTNDVSTIGLICVPNLSNLSGQNTKYEQTSSYSLLANQSSCPQLDHEDLEQIDEYDLEEMDLKWQVAMISMRMKKFYKKTGRKLQFDAKEAVGFDKTKVECYNCHKTGHFARECRFKGTQDNRRRDAWNSGNKDGSRTGQKEDSKALVTVDGEGVDWTTHSEDEDYALMACNSSDSDTEVISCSTKCKESYANLKKLYDAQREQLSDASIEIKAYSQGLKKVEAQLVAHQQGQLWYEQKIKFMKIDLDDKTDVLTYHKKLLAEAQKEKEDLKAKVEKWQNSSKNLSKLLNTQMSANDKFGLGYGDHRYNGILSYENEVLQSVFKSKESDFENQPMNDRFAEGMHVVPPPMTGNYMPTGPEIEIDYSQFTYGPKQTQPSESESQSSECDTCESNISTEPSELVSEPVVIESNVESQPKVWSDAPIIEEYESDSDDECVYIPTKQQETPSFANQQVKTPRENVKSQNTHSQKPKVDKKELGHGFAVRACFVCGSLNHLIRDCDFHEKRMARKADLHLVSTARASSTKNYSTTRQSVNKQTVLTSTAMKVNTVKPIVHRVRSENVFHKTHSPKRPFKKTTVLRRTDFSNQKLNTAKVNAVSTVGGKRETAVIPSASLYWRPTKDTMDYPHRALKNKGIVDSGCSRHMTGNKAYLAEFQDFNGGPVAFGGSKGYITGKEFKNRDVIEFCGSKGIKREYSNARTPQQNGVAERKNNTLCIVKNPVYHSKTKHIAIRHHF